jgi:hypothetical protein
MFGLHAARLLTPYATLRSRPDTIRPEALSRALDTDRTVVKLRRALGEFVLQEGAGCAGALTDTGVGREILAVAGMPR